MKCLKEENRFVYLRAAPRGSFGTARFKWLLRGFQAARNSGIIQDTELWLTNTSRKLLLEKENDKRKRKASLWVALVMALAFVLSPLNVFAEELDTPVIEDPIDEIQYDSGNSIKNFTITYWNPSEGVNKTITGRSEVAYAISWTEGISSSFTGLVYYMYDTKIDGISRSFTPDYANATNASGLAKLDYIQNIRNTYIYHNDVL